MKKISATCLAGVISVCGAAAFSACNPQEQEGQENKTTASQSEWEKAFGYLTVEWNDQTYYPILSDNPRTNFSCNYKIVHNNNGETSTTELVSSWDYVKSASSLEGGGDNIAYYGWKDGDVYYDIGGGWRIDQETGKKIDYYTKTVITEELYNMGLDSGIYAYGGGDHVWALKLGDKFEEFTYSEEKEEYTASMRYEAYSTDATVTVKFKGGMISYMAVEINGSNYGDFVYTYSYTYGITVTVPEFFLNLKLGETDKNQP